MRWISPFALIVYGAACGSTASGNGQDASGGMDAPAMPAPPVLGAQLARMGRPAIQPTLIAAFASDTAQTAERTIYNQVADPAAWAATMLDTNVTIADEMRANLIVFDAIDAGLAAQNQTLTGCGNALAYDAPARPASYQTAAAIFADDQLYIDTSRTTCEVYLALELELATAETFVHTTCGGRTPTHDVIDVTYSVLAAGTDALDPANHFHGKITDGVGPHADVTIGFPFLGPPH